MRASVCVCGGSSGSVFDEHDGYLRTNTPCVALCYLLCVRGDERRHLGSVAARLDFPGCCNCANLALSYIFRVYLRNASSDRGMTGHTCMYVWSSSSAD